MFCFETKAALRKKNTILQARIYEMEEQMKSLQKDIAEMRKLEVVLGGMSKNITIEKALSLLDHFAELVHRRFEGRRY